MLRVALLLLGAAVIRFVLTDPVPPEPPLASQESIADSLLAAGDSVLQEKERRSRPLSDGEKIDPNRAAEAELDRLPGVGASKALRIVQDREANGPFQSVEDLVRVPGLGPASVDRLRPFLEIRSRPAGPAAVPRRHAGRAAPDPARSKPDPARGAPLRLNRATEAELQQLPGVGPVMAKRIIAFREERGGFRSPDDLLEIAGIGPKVLARLLPLVTTQP